MPKIRTANKRDKARHKARYGHDEDGRSVFTLEKEIEKKAEKAKRARK